VSDNPSVLYGVQDRIATITLNRPDRLNAYTAQMSTGIKASVSEANSDSTVRVIIITGAGRGFCAGADMESLAGRAQGAHNDSRAADGEPKDFSPAPGPDLTAHFRDADRFTYFVRAKKPVIAAVNGPAAGIGLVMALYADLRFASDKAIFTTSFAQRGLIAEHGISWLLPRIVGQANALDLLFSARKVSAGEAEKIGLVNRVFPQESFMNDVRAYATGLADTSSPRSIAIMKAQVWKANFQDYNAALAVADEEMAVSLDHDEFREGVAHFIEKRAPRFANI